ncbi:carbon-nitrogen hydrolase family protein [Pigmentibacter sp. JX0631]|uniref:carbon-nitrogen hydrolase family protein n=1 Tax=Pigmentibacter sp. JX0631 TaxID=2976982 RepID=UPI0024699F99|nr:carbon-nitrogen hydrolase family protein [Pigmentibacter sp. JX0631]WGL58775.1 carbon-nitrogen hydrolase family protein [Pigmentibacter sp. JX0631]
MKNKIHVATAQFSPLAGNLGYNVKKICTILEESAQKNVQLVLFPELAICGYDLKLIDEGRGVFSEDGSGLNFLFNTCKNCKIAAIVGCCIQKGSKIYNSALIINEFGELIQIYDKQLLDAEEKEIFNFGEKTCVFKIHDWNFGIAISYDCYSLDITTKLKFLQIDAYLILGAFIKGGYYSFDLNHFALLAKEFECYVVVSNFIGSHGGLTFSGNSSIYAKNGDLLNNCFENFGVTYGILEKNIINSEATITLDNVINLELETIEEEKKINQ